MPGVRGLPPVAGQQLGHSRPGGRGVLGSALSIDQHAKNNLPDVLARWRAREGAERERPRTAQSFSVPVAEIAAQGYDLSINRYKKAVHDEVEHRSPSEILAELAEIEDEIQRGIAELRLML